MASIKDISALVASQHSWRTCLDIIRSSSSSTRRVAQAKTSWSGED